MAASKDFRELIAWQLAHQLDLRVEVFLGCPEFRHHFKFCEQLGRAARSGPRHIAEGHARITHDEFAQSVRIAKESEAAVLNHLIDAHRQRLITTDELTINTHLAKRAMRAASGLIRYLESTPDAASQERNTKSHRGANQSPESRIPPAQSIGGGKDDDHRADTGHD